MRGGRLVLAVALALLAILSVSAPASAITYGTPDTTHTFVGAFMLIGPDNSIIGFCSGSLVSSRVFLAAGHCGMDVVGLPVDQLRVTFGADMHDQSAWRTVASVVVDPDYSTVQSDPHDIAVLILSKPVKGITPGNLAPTAGYLDELAASGGLVPHETTFQVVGYGRDQNYQFALIRQETTDGFLALEAAWLDNSKNPSLGFGGACYCDSGGPVLYTSGSTQYIVAIVSTGDAMCRGTDKNYRVDTAESLNFVSAQIAAYK